jgi:indolepyruvate ferredoxin oxidoreductase beta subunit
MPVTNVLIAGVGGQGAVLASELLALAAIAAGHDVKQGEFHGVAQRGGAVFSHVRFGDRVYSPMAPRDRVYSPMAPRGDVDYLLAMEKLEALRYAHFVKPGGTIIVNDQKIEPIRVADKRPYPDEAIDFLASKGFNVMVIKATDKAVELGNHRAANVVLLGALSGSLDIRQETWESTLRERIPEKLLALNAVSHPDCEQHTECPYPDPRPGHETWPAIGNVDLSRWWHRF